MVSTFDSETFKSALAKFPSGVTVVTTSSGGDSFGFTASAFCSVSLDPPLVLVCLQKDAQCFPAFAASESMGISILSAAQAKVALQFASRGGDKFAQGEFMRGECLGDVLVRGAAAHMECRLVARHDAGDHVILVGQVLAARSSAADVPIVYYDRSFGTFVGE